jgi:HD-GYP domain-containing protein (c-di-GMP phosphodiesterase class II)
MNWQAATSVVVSILSTIAAILAWVAKIRWSDEYTRAKDEIIKAKDEQIKSLQNEIGFLREMSPMKLREYFVSVKSQLEEYNEAIEHQLESAKTEIKKREEQINELQNRWETEKSNIDWEMNSGVNLTLEGWAKSVDLREGATEGHSLRVTEITLKIASAMKISDDQIINMRRGALLHDIGKVGIPDEILRKPGPLTPEEQAFYHKHPQFAYDLLSGIEYLRPALDIPYCHHERWDGSGYPRGLRGTEIPLSARIFSVVDAWDALNTDRPYRRGLSQKEIFNYLNEQSGITFDPDVVKIFMKILQDEKLP